MMVHPTERALIGFQDGFISERRRKKVARHLAKCADCRAIIQSHRGLRSALLSEAPPPPPPSVLERVLASRAEGAVMVLPLAEPLAESPSSSWWRNYNWRFPRAAAGSFFRVSALTGAIAAMGFVVISLTGGDTVLSSGASSLGARWKAFASDFDPLKFDDARPITKAFNLGVGPAVVFDESAMRELTAEYSYQSQRGTGNPTTVAARLVDPASLTWRVTTSTPKSERDRGFNDSRWSEYRGPEMTLTSWGSNRRIWRLTPEAERPYDYTRHEIWEIVDGTVVDNTTYSGELSSSAKARSATEKPRTRPIASVIDVPVTSGMFSTAILLGSVQLSSNWAGSTRRSNRLTWDSAPNGMTYLVSGSETITVPAGTFEAWVVEVYSEYQPRVWVQHHRKSDGLMLRYAETDPRGAIYELNSVTFP